MSKMSHPTLGTFEVSHDRTGMVTVTPALYGDEATSLLASYPGLEDACRLRQEALSAEGRESELLARALTAAAAERAQGAQDARVAACRRHRAVRSAARIWGWTECVAGGRVLGGGARGRRPARRVSVRRSAPHREQRDTYGILGLAQPEGLARTR